MGKFTGILIVSDLDGTFFSKIPEMYDKNVRAIERFKSEGGVFTFATGRDHYSLLTVVPEAEKIANAPIIIANGARLYDKDKKEYLYTFTLNMNMFSEFWEIACEKYPDIGVRFSGEKGIVIPDLNEIMRQDFNDVALKNIKFREMPVKELAESGEDIYKCVIVHTPEILDDVRKIGESFDKDLNRELFYTKSYPRGLEVVDKKSSKGEMALRLKKYVSDKYNADNTYSINNKEIKLFAIGDYDNDISMLEAADYGAAPENALDHVKEAAEILTASCNEGAVADLIDIIEKKIENKYI